MNAEGLPLRLQSLTSRKRKYSQVYAVLENGELYSPGSIVNHAQAMGLLPALEPAALKQLKVKIRHTLLALARNRGFPSEGDGWVLIPGQKRLRGYFGWRWKAAVGCADQGADSMVAHSEVDP